MPPKREKGTLALDPDLREKGARREGKTHLLSLTERRGKRTLIHPQMEMNQNPAQRQKGWGLVRKDPTYKKNTGGQSCQKQNENST